MSQFLSVSFVAITNKCDIFNNMKTVTVVTSIKCVTGRCDKYEKCDNCVSNDNSDNCDIFTSMKTLTVVTSVTFFTHMTTVTVVTTIKRMAGVTRVTGGPEWTPVTYVSVMTRVTFVICLLR